MKKKFAFNYYDMLSLQMVILMPLEKIISILFFLILVCIGIVFRFIKDEVFAWLLWKNNQHR